MKVLLVLVLAVSLAQFAPSCEGRNTTVIGWVDAKFYHGGRESFVVVINNVEYNVPDDFYYVVEVGDLVKSEGGIWSIVKKRGV